MSLNGTKEKYQHIYLLLAALNVIPAVPLVLLVRINVVEWYKRVFSLQKRSEVYDAITICIEWRKLNVP